MTDYLHKELSSEEVEAGAEDFAIRDEKGRAIGVVYTIRKITTRPHEEGERECYWRLPFPDTTHYAATVQATRDGQRYGASQAGARVPTLGETRSIIARRVASSRRRYVKKYGVQEAGS